MACTLYQGAVRSTFTPSALPSGGVAAAISRRPPVRRTLFPTAAAMRSLVAALLLPWMLGRKTNLAAALVAAHDLLYAPSPIVVAAFTPPRTTPTPTPSASSSASLASTDSVDSAYASDAPLELAIANPSPAAGCCSTIGDATGDSTASADAIDTTHSRSRCRRLLRWLLETREGRLCVIVFGVCTLVLGIVLSCVPWLDYIILKHLRLWNDTLSYQYWQRPGITRLTKVYVFNVTNPDGFLNHGEKPRLVEVGPFVYREDMEKVNIEFHDNGTVSFQHNKILKFVPELSVDIKTMVTVPNIPLLTLSTMSNSLMRVLQTMLSMFLRTMNNMTPFVHVSVEELLFGYDDTLVTLANRFFPQHKRPAERMGLLLSRNGTIKDVQTIFTGHSSMTEFGYMDRLNGLDRMPHWKAPPCNSIRASEGSFFPPYRYTKSDILYVYDKDLCRIWPLERKYSTSRDGVEVDFYTPPENIFWRPEKNPENKCFCPNNDADCPPDGLQDIAPCQFDAPVYLSYPHFYKSDPTLLDAVEGLSPDKEKHESYFKIQPKLGVPLEAQVRVQLNLKVDHAPNIHVVKKFPSITIPIVWVQEGVAELTPTIINLIYLATTIADGIGPVVNYGCIVVGLSTLIFIFVRAYKNVVFTKETLERGKETLRRGSSFIINGQHRLLILRDSYTLLNNMSTDPDPEADQDADV